MSEQLRFVPPRVEFDPTLANELARFPAAPPTVAHELTRSSTGAVRSRTMSEKLKAEAEAIAAGGWKWISVAVVFPYDHASDLREVHGKRADFTTDEQATIDALDAEHAKLEFDYQDADEICTAERRRKHSRACTIPCGVNDAVKQASGSSRPM